MIWFLFLICSPAYAAEDFEIIESGSPKGSEITEKSAGVVQLSDEFYPGFSINSSVNLSGNFRVGAVEASIEETFKMSDGGVNAFISVPITLNQFRPSDSSARNTPRVGGGPLPVLKFGFEVYRNQDNFGEFGAMMYLPYDSSNRMRFGLMAMGSYKHRFILGRFVLDAKFSAGTSFSSQFSNSSTLFAPGNNQTTEQEPAFQSSLECFPNYLLTDSIALVFGGIWSYRAPSRATQNGTVVHAQSASNDVGLGIGAKIQTSKSSILSPLIYRMVAPFEAEDRNNMGMMLNWLVYI
jgi:hypothetical protein